MTRTPTDERPRIGVSACLLGAPVRFDGGHKRDDFMTDELARFVDFVPVCPEMDLGLGAPRESLRLVGSAKAPRLVAPRSGSPIFGSGYAPAQNELPFARRLAHDRGTPVAEANGDVLYRLARLGQPDAGSGAP